MAECCVIIGAGPGIGAAAARAFAREGLDIALIARKPDRLTPLATEIHWTTGREVRCIAADATDPAGLLAALSAAQSALGTPRVLLYNAASPQRGRPLGLSGEQLARDLAVNVGGALTATQALAPVMRAAGRGCVLLTGGSMAESPAMEYASLSLGKAALRNLCYTLAQELGPHGIHVAMVTVHGILQSGTRLDPARAAEEFVQLYRQQPGDYELERHLR